MCTYKLVVLQQIFSLINECHVEIFQLEKKAGRKLGKTDECVLQNYCHSVFIFKLINACIIYI